MQLVHTITYDNVLPCCYLVHQMLRPLWHSTKGKSTPAQLYLAQMSPSCAVMFSATLTNSYPCILNISPSKGYTLHWNSLQKLNNHSLLVML